MRIGEDTTKPVVVEQQVLKRANLVGELMSELVSEAEGDLVEEVRVSKAAQLQCKTIGGAAQMMIESG